MRHVISMKLAVLAGLILAISSVCIGQMPQPFSADMTITHNTGEKVTGKIFFSPPKNRMDMTAPAGKGGPMGGRMSMINDPTTQTMYMIMHDKKMYMEMHANQLAGPMMGHAPSAPSSFDPNHPCGPDATCKKVGTETVNGRVCDKWVTTDKNGTSTAWIDQKLWYPIKAQSSSGETLELTNVKEGRQDASLFQPPAGYQKMTIPAMGGRPPR